MRKSILLIDDDPAIVRVLTRLFQREGWEVHASNSGQEGVEFYLAHQPDMVLLDLHLPGMSGIAVLQLLVAKDATVILLTGHGDIGTAVEAMQIGAENFLVKPIAPPHLLAAAERALEKVMLRRANRTLAANWIDGHRMAALGCSPKMQEVARHVELLAGSDGATVLLLGESGTGKGWVAQTIHAHSPRARAPFVDLNCAGLSATLLDSELFGHEKGAFTDAKTMKRGLFEVADGGTLFLDEVGDLAPELQPKLLKVLERQAFRRVGGTREIEVDVRLIAATNHDLEKLVANGRFRKDLFYRLNVLPLTLPPVREREMEDVLELVHRLMADLGSRHPNAASSLSEKALELLLRYQWPGNVRDLRNALERAMVLSAGQDQIRPEHLPLEVRSPYPDSIRWPSGQRALTLEEVERQHIERVLTMQGGNRTRAAEALGVSRATLHNKIRRYGQSSLAVLP